MLFRVRARARAKVRVRVRGLGFGAVITRTLTLTLMLTLTLTLTLTHITGGERAQTSILASEDFAVGGLVHYSGDANDLLVRPLRHQHNVRHQLGVEYIPDDLRNPSQRGHLLATGARLCVP